MVIDKLLIGKKNLKKICRKICSTGKWLLACVFREQALRMCIEQSSVENIHVL